MYQLLPYMKRKKSLSTKLLGLLLSLSLLACPPSGVSAEQHETENWWIINATGAIGQKEHPSPFKYWLEGQKRFNNDDSEDTQTLLRPGLGYTLNKELSIWLGYAWLYTTINLRPSVTEQRIWQQLLWIKNTPKLKFVARTRFEERFFDGNSKKGYRTRQLIKIAIPIKTTEYLDFATSDELFWNNGTYEGRINKGFDQNRYFIGFDYHINKNSTVEMGYMNQYIKLFDRTHLLANIAAISLLLNFN